MDNDDIEGVARRVQQAFIDIRRDLQSKTQNEAQKDAIASLPHDKITGAAENRLKKFPNDCCMDASFVLANVLLIIAEQKSIKFGQLMHIRCRPTEKTKTVMFDFHQWLSVNGYNVDIAFEQCKTVLKGNEGKIIFDTHPLVESDDYTFEGITAEKFDPYMYFSSFVIEQYFHR
jgi:hypothetical protein